MNLKKWFQGYRGIRYTRRGVDGLPPLASAPRTKCLGKLQKADFLKIHTTYNVHIDKYLCECVKIYMFDTYVLLCIWYTCISTMYDCKIYTYVCHCINSV